MRRRVLVEWFAVAGALLALAASLIATGLPQRLDLTLYDAAQRIATRVPHKDIVIIAIDERSLTALGRWPWPRETHARLLDRLTDAGARAVAVDLLLTEPDTRNPRGDAQLAASLSRNARTVLPLHMDAADGRVRAITPAPLFAAAAKALGHVNTELDADGVARSVFLREGPGTAKYSHLAVALLDSVETRPQTLPGIRAPARPAADAWARDFRYAIPFAGPPSHFPRLSYVDVLHGNVDADALEGMGDGLVVLDRGGRILYINGRASGLLGATATAGTPIAELFAAWLHPPEFRIDAVLAAVMSGQPQAGARLVSPRGDVVLLGAVPWRGADVTVAGAIVTLADIEPLERAERLRRDALKLLSHDLRAPLNAIIASTADSANSAGGTASEQLRNVRRSAGNALELADDFLAIAQAEYLESAAHEEVDMARICEEAGDALYGLGHARNIRVAIETVDTECTIRGDSGLLKRAVSNVLANAIRHSPSDTAVTLKVSATYATVSVQIEDRGPGIPSSEIPHLFQRQRRSTGRSGGSALGLVLVKSVVDGHQGTISVTSANQGGACFVLEFPAAGAAQSGGALP